MNKREARIKALEFVLDSVRNNRSAVSLYADSDNDRDKVDSAVWDIIGPLEDRLRKLQASR